MPARRFWLKHCYERFTQSYTNFQKISIQACTAVVFFKIKKKARHKTLAAKQKKMHTQAISITGGQQFLGLSAPHAKQCRPSLSGSEINKATHRVDSSLPHGMPPSNARSGQTCSWPDRYQWALSTSPRSKVLNMHIHGQHRGPEHHPSFPANWNCSPTDLSTIALACTESNQGPQTNEINTHKTLIQFPTQSGKRWFLRTEHAWITGTQKQLDRAGGNKKRMHCNLAGMHHAFLYIFLVPSSAKSASAYVLNMPTRYHRVKRASYNS